ncbi:secreted immunoglobulin domain 1 [Xiphias gladius]|uniref:secreted immunoglobulin domain 1 n=1 Tax=Xiphias gladius TaxID=8245 RepID=UPI001A995B74|nr:secreted immunoglobulin domain 1 [Xiphias gladius]
MKRSAGLKNNSSSSSFLCQLKMESALVCLILVSLSGFRWGHPAAAPPAATVEVRVGEDATLHCPLLDQSNAASATLSWYKKAAGRGPQLLLTMRSADSSHVKYGSGVRPDKVSAAADGSLLLRRSEQSDSAVYYCAVSQGGRLPQKGPELRAGR